MRIARGLSLVLLLRKLRGLRDDPSVAGAQADECGAWSWAALLAGDAKGGAKGEDKAEEEEEEEEEGAAKRPQRRRR